MSLLSTDFLLSNGIKSLLDGSLIGFANREIAADGARTKGSGKE